MDKRNKVWGIVYLAPPSEGIEVDLTLKASENPRLTVTDQSDGLPKHHWLPRRTTTERPDVFTSDMALL